MSKFTRMHRNLNSIVIRRQRGVSLVVVIIFVMLSMLLALWASRTSMFNEMVVSNDADYQRAFEAAQALLQDAELDIRGERADGKPCDFGGLPAAASERVCRRGAVQKIPLEAQEVGLLLAELEETSNGNATGCKNALCTKRVGPMDFWNNNNAALGPTRTQMFNAGANGLIDGVGARYGQYTGALTGSNASTNPILRETAADRGGMYWIEVLPYDESSKYSGILVGGAGNLLALNLTPSVVYRITAIAYGRKENTIVVLQQTYAQQKQKD